MPADDSAGAVRDARRRALRHEATQLFQAALRAVDPQQLVQSCLSGHAGAVRAVLPSGDTVEWRSPTVVVGAGKAAARMAAGCEAVLGPDAVSGSVVVADGCAVRLASIEVVEAGHPLPDMRGAAATRDILARVGDPQAGGILCVLSGGASSLLVQPRSPVTVADKVATTEALLRCGADINELNTVRKHLSDVKGGGLARRVAGAVVSLIISDVVGDDPGTIGSGPTSPDPTTFADALAVLDRYDLTERVPRTVMQVLNAGRTGQVPETLKPGVAVATRCRSFVIGSNRTALEGAAAAARARGWEVHVEPEPLIGDTTDAARRFAARLHALRVTEPLCLLAGGETTVRVHGTGRGGRNQEFALALAAELAGGDLMVLSAGTDGIDGPTDAAGAFVDGTTIERARQRGLDVRACLANNDSYAFFAELGDLLRCGPTGTNVMDIKLALVPAPCR